MGIVGPQIYQPKFGPTYRVSYSTSIGLLSLNVVSVLTAWWTVVRSDRARATKLEATADSPVLASREDGSKGELGNGDENRGEKA